MKNTMMINNTLKVNPFIQQQLVERTVTVRGIDSSWNETMALIYQMNQRQNGGRSFSQPNLMPDLEARPRVGKLEISLDLH